MRREYASIGSMAALLVGSQAVAIALSPLFQGSGYQAFPNPSDVTNTVVYVILILVFTAVILGLVRYRRQNLAKYVIMASIFVTLAFVLLLPLYYGLYYGTGENQDPNFQNFLANAATLLSFAAAAVLVYLLVKFPEWYVVDTIGFVTAAGVTAILGISFGLLPAILLLIALAVYDAWAVYRTKHMITLADELTSQRLPILLVIPKKAGYSFREQKSLKEQVASAEEREPERRPAPRLPRHEPPRVRHGPLRVTHNGHIRPVLWRGPDGPLARTLETQADRRPLPAVP